MYWILTWVWIISYSGFELTWVCGFGNILGTWELCCSIRGFIAVWANQIANFKMKTTSLILKFDLNLWTSLPSLKFIKTKWLDNHCESFLYYGSQSFVIQGKAILSQARGWGQQHKGSWEEIWTFQKAPFKIPSTILLNVDTVTTKLGKRHSWQELKMLWHTQSSVNNNSPAFLPKKFEGNLSIMFVWEKIVYLHLG